MRIATDFLGGKQQVVGIGSALVDILAKVSDAFLEELGGARGGMVFADRDFIEEAQSRLPEPPEIVPGGSSCNTTIGIGSLGGNARFVGKCGRDAYGDLIRKDLIANNVDPMLFASDTPTGRVLSVITPDAQRTMFTCLGAASEMQSDEADTDCFKDAAIVHIEGYMLYDRDLIVAVLENAKKAGARISLDLASYTVVEESGAFLKQIVADYVDILIANEDEARSFAELSDESAAVDYLAGYAPIAAVKIGKRGSYIAHEGRARKISPKAGRKATDTTGAGDLWASGFLFGLVNNRDLEQCGWLGSLCGYEVCQVIGAAIPQDGWQRIRQQFGLH